MCVRVLQHFKHANRYNIYCVEWSCAVSPSSLETSGRNGGMEPACET